MNQIDQIKDLPRQGLGAQEIAGRLKKIVADLSLDNSILKETVRGNF